MLRSNTANMNCLHVQSGCTVRCIRFQCSAVLPCHPVKQQQPFTASQVSRYGQLHASSAHYSSYSSCSRSQSVLCRAGSKAQHSSGAAATQKAASQKQQDDMDDVIIIEDDEAELEVLFDEDDLDEFEDDDDLDEFEDEDGFFDDDEGEDDEGLFGLGSDEDPGPELLTGNVTWGDKALAVAKTVLEKPENQNLDLYLFRVLVPNKTIEIRLDRLDDAYGSPDVDDIERFSRAMVQGLEAELGVEAAGDIALEVSSPGAERQLIIPQDLDRFKDLPMRVEFMTEVGTIKTLVLKYIDRDMAEGISTWELADVKANQAVKGRSLSKKQRLQRYTIPISELERVRIYVDF